MIKRSMRFLSALALLTIAADAQMIRGSFTGTVTDATGAAVPLVKINVKNLATGIERDATTNDAGVYRVIGVEPGAYRLEFKKDGFETFVVARVEVNTGAEVTFNPALALGTAATVVEVTEPPVGVELSKSSATVERTFQSKFVNEAPLTGATRDVNVLALTAPTASRGPASTGIAANGQRARNNSFMLDGVDNNDPSVTIANLRVIPESVDQFQVQTSPYSAEFGRASGAQISVVTKGGSNEFHGNVFNYYRANWMEPVNLLNQRAGLTATPRFNQNQAGGSLGGRIIRDRTFFFALIEANRRREAADARNSTSATIPTQAGFQQLSSLALGPDQTTQSRQAVLGGLSFLNQIYALNPGFTNQRTVTVNNVAIPVGTINIPLANPSNFWYGVTRLDHRLTDNHQLSYRYTIDDRIQPDVVSNLQFGSIFSGAQAIRRQNHMASDTWTIGTRAVNEFRFAYVKGNLDFPENDPVTPTTTISGLFTIGGLSNFPQGRTQNQYQFQDTFTYNTGRHSIRTGFNYSYLKLLNISAFNSKGVYTFDNFQDYLNNRAATLAVALDVASFDARQHQQAYFIQDEFKMRPNLTLTMGVRYETSNIPFGAFGATDSQSLSAGVPGPARNDRNNFAPRFGFAYSPSSDSGFMGKLIGKDRTVIRGGYGMTYDYLFFNILTVTGGNFPRVRTANVDRNTLPNAWPSLRTGAAPGFDPRLAYVNAPENLQSPTAHIWSLSIQRQIGSGFILELGHSGSRSYHGVRQGQLNPGILTAAQAATVRSTNNAASIDGLPGVTGANPLPSRRLNPAWGARTTIETTANGLYSAGYVRFDKRLSHGLSFGGNYTFSGNWSDNDESLGVADITNSSPQVPQDYFNYRSEYSRSVFDRPHRFVTYWNYELPWLKDSGNRAARMVLGGWQVSGIFDTQSGQPFTIRTGVDTNGIGTAAPARPNLNAGGAFTQDAVSNDLRTFVSPINGTGRYITTLNAAGIPLANSSNIFGNLGRNTLRGPKFSNWNLATFKNFAITERWKVQLRADFINAFNQYNFGNPVATMNSPIFGTNTTNPGNRTMLTSAKIIF
jgi:hypothetical protein